MNMTSKRETRALATAADPRWAAVLARDAKADGQFFYTVRSTGVYCRPSCPARTPLPENVAFHDNAQAAERAGYRPCRRCKPDQPSLAEQHAATVAMLCREIERAEQAPSLAQLAERAGMSSFHLHRLFKAATGVTPKAYADAQRAQRMRQGLTAGSSVTAAIYDAGYASGSRFYEQADGRLGMTASEFKSGGSAQTEIRFAIGQCSLGAILVACSERGVCAIELGDDPQALAHELQDRFPQAQLIGGDAEFERLIAQVVGLVEAPDNALPLPLDVRGTAFQQRVWQALREIPAGKTLSYAEVAERIGSPTAVRAVAQACGANTLAVAIPCHRVVRSDGSLSGYRWGVERKKALLAREARG